MRSSVRGEGTARRSIEIGPTKSMRQQRVAQLQVTVEVQTRDLQRADEIFPRAVRHIPAQPCTPPVGLPSCCRYGTVPNGPWKSSL
jgi:hypothetical protein